LTRQAILLYLHAQILVVCLNEMPRRPSDETVKPIGSPGGARTAYTSLFTQKMMQETGGDSIKAGMLATWQRTQMM